MASFEQRMKELEKTKGFADKEYISAVLEEAALTPASQVMMNDRAVTDGFDDITDIISYFGFFFGARQYITISELLLLRELKVKIDLQSEWLSDIELDRICPDIMMFSGGLFYRSHNEQVIEKLFSLNYGAFLEEIHEMPGEGEKIYSKALKYIKDPVNGLNETFGNVFNNIRSGLCAKWIPLHDDIDTFQQKVRKSYSMMKDCIFDPLCFRFSQDNSADKVIEKYDFFEF